jgi:hypothetical protein
MKSLEMLKALLSEEVCFVLWKISLVSLGLSLLIALFSVASVLLAESFMDVERRIAPIKTKRTSVSFVRAFDQA